MNVFDFRSIKSKPLAFGYIITRAVLLLLISGSVIGFLHHLDLLLAFICIIRILYFVFVNASKKMEVNTRKLVYLGMAITGLSGAVSEILGIYFGFWEYHDLSDFRMFPYWLPFAWALSFLFLFRIENRFVQLIPKATYIQKLVITGLISFIFPTIGEMVTIHLGVWTYYDMGPKLLGVPYLAMFLLMLLHSFIFTVLCYVAQKKQIESTIFKF